MKISLIVAVAQNGVIGKDNDLAWHLPDDMKFFMDTTRNHHVVMGRKNWDSIPEKYRPLKDRTNLVLTRNPDYSLEEEDTFVFQELNDCIEFARERGEKEFFIIGGAQIYSNSMDLVDTMYITEVDGNPEGDTFFPDFDKDQWEESSRVHHPADDRHSFSFDFVIYDRKEV